jgi:hypothetical protein
MIKQIYTKDKKIKITFRCDDALSNWLVQRSGMMEITPSAFVRQMLFSQMYAEKTLGGIVKKNMDTSTETAVAECKHQD